jgi:hypothetical protein
MAMCYKCEKYPLVMGEINKATRVDNGIEVILCTKCWEEEFRAEFR